MGTPLACSTVPYEAEPLARALERVARAGFERVVVGPAHAGEPVVDVAAGARGASPLKSALDAAGLGLAALYPRLSPVDDATAEAVATILEQAKMLSCPQVWISSPQAFDESHELRPEEDWQRDVDALAANIPALCAKAKELGLAVAVPTEARLTDCGANAEAFLARIGDAEVGLAYNPGLVSYFTGVNPKRDIEAVGGRLAALCVRDHRGAPGEAAFPPVGGGQVGYIDLFGILKGQRFSGPVVVEHLPGGTPEELDASAKTTKLFLDKLIGL